METSSWLSLYLQAASPALAHARSLQVEAPLGVRLGPGMLALLCMHMPNLEEVRLQGVLTAETCGALARDLPAVLALSRPNLHTLEVCTRDARTERGGCLCGQVPLL